MSTSIEGRIAVDVSFADKSEASGVQSLKKISLTDAQAYTTGKVAILTGTCGTAASLVSWTFPAYTNAGGEAVSMTNLRRVVFSATPYARANVGLTRVGTSLNGELSAMSFIGADIVVSEVSVACTSGTASYTLVLYGT